MTAEQRRDLLEMMEDRHGRGSTVVTSQLPVEHWHEIIGNPTIADAILDRLVHNAHRLTLKGESLASWTLLYQLLRLLRARSDLPSRHLRSVPNDRRVIRIPCALADSRRAGRSITVLVFDATWLRIPTKSAVDSGRSRPPVPIEAGQGFR